MNIILMNTNHEIFMPRFEEELNEHKILYKKQVNAFEYYIYIFDTIIGRNNAKDIYNNLIIEFKYDVEIKRLEDLMYSQLFDNYCTYERKIYRLLSMIIYDRFSHDIMLKELCKYPDFLEKGYIKSKKIEERLHELKEQIRNSDDYKIKKINILGQMLDKYNIEH